MNMNQDSEGRSNISLLSLKADEKLSAVLEQLYSELFHDAYHNIGTAEEYAEKAGKYIGALFSVVESGDSIIISKDMTHTVVNGHLIEYEADGISGKA